MDQILAYLNKNLAISGCSVELAVDETVGPNSQHGSHFFLTPCRFFFFFLISSPFSRTYWRIELHCSMIEIVHEDRLKKQTAEACSRSKVICVFVALQLQCDAAMYALRGYVTLVNRNPEVFTLWLSIRVRLLYMDQPTSRKGSVSTWIKHSTRFSALFKCCTVKRSV